MATAIATETGEIQAFRLLARLTDQCVKVNVAGVTHEESLVQPQPDGNCLNWVLGHLAAVYNNALPLLGQEPVMEKGALQRYERGSPPLEDAAEALPLSQLLATWDEVAARVDAGLGNLTTEALDQPSPFSPSGDADETIRTLVTTVLFHQAYHVGQTGLLRRIAGHEGAIK